MTIKGFSDQQKTGGTDSLGGQQFATINPVREQQNALDVLAHLFHQVIATDEAETGSTTTIIKATGHAAQVGDAINFTAGNLDDNEYRVKSLPDADHIQVSETMSEAPANGDTFKILRPKIPVVSNDGELSVGVTFANDTDYGPVSSDTLRTAAQIGNATGAADFGAGNVGAQVLRTTPAADSPHLLATRHEAAATPVATRTGNGTNFDAYGSGADGATVPRSTLSTRHEAVATPLAAQISNGSAAANFNSGVAGAATLRTIEGARSLADSDYHDYAGGTVTTLAWTELIASTAGAYGDGL